MRRVDSDLVRLWVINNMIINNSIIDGIDAVVVIISISIVALG